MRDPAPVRFGLSSFLFLMGAFWGVPASAAVSIAYTIGSSYTYSMGSSDPGDPNPGGVSEQHFIASTDPDRPSELGINYTAYADTGGFYFLHQNYCVGSCSTYSRSIVSINLTNNDPDPVNLRFDTMITPGHLAAIGQQGSTSGSYAFEIFQNGTNIFTTTGHIFSDGLQVDPGMIDSNPLTFNGYTDSFTGNAHTIDWGATNLSVPLMTIAGNSTTVLTYSAVYQVSNDVVCTDLTDCSSLEVVFGDPRNDGSVLALRTFGAQGLQPLDKAVIGGSYDPYFVPIEFVPVGSPDPDAPPDAPVINYTANFKSNVIDDGDISAAPEPATWATMLCGFGFAGVALRRRRAVIAAAR
jgi:hypothetical protein